MTKPSPVRLTVDHRRRRWRQRGLDNPERRINIGLHRPIKLLGRNLQNRVMCLLTRGVADEDVKTAGLVHRVSNETLAKTFVSNVAGKQHNLQSFRFEQIGYVACIGLLDALLKPLFTMEGTSTI
jgi:hypothetical protein